jgi:nucleotide-binding universal stress UspA family protein
MSTPSAAALPWQRLLLCVDGSAYSEVCCRYAAWLARRTGLTIEALYVSDVWTYESSFLSDLGGSLGAQPYQNMIGQLEVVEEGKAKLIEAALRAVFTQEGLADRVTFHHRTGGVVEALTTFEKGAGAVSLVMMGKRGEHADLATGHLGSTMERVVRASTKPCLVTPRALKPVCRVLLAYDGSPSSTKALHWLVQAAAFQDLELVLATVAATDGQEKAEELLREGDNLLRAGGWKASVQLLVGEPGDAIADYVEHQGVDLLIMGAYGHGALRRLLVGSTTTDLVRRCHVPVLLFR